ncbi:spore germination protein [Brevibacillus humidisoli]|uniref:GerAB/ArcD/ProY family transporter n=1 Tax=Brevibacillus humidisoli TaxID=2895522 RepID=UPI001E624A2C|nr:endospore germination permease [Brevibacillus humidisoli]UFJ39190.1 spore germination protein [Brevibacillus humidisoli]
MSRGNDQLFGTFSTWQLTTLVTSTLIGVGVLTLPRATSTALEQSGWLAPFIGGLISIAACWLIAQLSRLYPGRTIVRYSPLVWGTTKSVKVGVLLSLPFVVSFLLYLFTVTAFTARIFGEVVVTAVLLQTPLEATIITMFLLVVALCQYEPEVVARVNELLFPLIILPILLLAIASFQKADWNNLLPVQISSWDKLVDGLMESTISFEGFEVMFIYFAFAQQGTSRRTASVVGITMAILVYTLIVLAGIAVFGPNELQLLTWPTLELVKTTQVPGLVLERIESAFLAVWVAAVFTTVGNVYYAFIYGLRQLLGRGMAFQRIMSVFLLIPLFAVALFPQNLDELFRYSSYLGYLGLVVNLVYPLLYIIVSYLRKRHRKAVRGESVD